MKRTLAIFIAFALGLVLSKNIKAQEVQRIQQMEATIAQLQYELEQLKASRGLPTETNWQLQNDTSTIVDQNLIAPGYDPRKVVQQSGIELPPASLAVPQTNLPAASRAPTIGPPVQQSFERLPPAPTVIQSRPLQVLPVEVDYCPLTGRVYQRVERAYYYRVPVVPYVEREWDYWDEDRFGR
ncbi:hypothetical protein OAG68_02585 [bacterium]|nr:hypothetical protein [bacterium]